MSGLTPIRVGPRSVIIRRSWGVVRKCRDGRDIIQGQLRHVSDAQGRHPDASTAPTWLWLLACRRPRYETGRPSGSVETTRMDLLECWIFITIDLGAVGSEHSPPLQKHVFTSRLAQVFKARQRHDEGKEGSLWLIRLREQRTRPSWRPSTIPWATLAARGALARSGRCGDIN